jgi:hypothetical protein
MPLNKKGQKIKAAMKKEYGAKKGEQVFYASENKGTIKGVTKRKAGYAKGGYVNCGASVKPNGKAKK